jgi:hypothetical protein
MEYGSDRDIFGRRHSGDTLDRFPPRGSERSFPIQFFRHRLAVPYEINVHALLNPPRFIREVNL